MENISYSNSDNIKYRNTSTNMVKESSNDNCVAERMHAILYNLKNFCRTDRISSYLENACKIEIQTYSRCSTICLLIKNSVGNSISYTIIIHKSSGLSLPVDHHMRM